MADPRAALVALTAAFERHLEACAQRRGEDDPAVVAAYDDLADAFEEYDESLLEAFGEMTPLELYAGEDDDSDEDEELDEEPDDEDDLDDDDDDLDDEDDDESATGSDDESDSDQRYLGLDDEEFDVVELGDDAAGHPS
ncbi:MAG TPA: hypothetical protein PKH97_06090 [Tetrasphaera sp.]|uniref:hypothetical protein n=1 Tax=Nostocoides sp. TaxID=1917966 RepID=UPI002D1746D9|nr:hypothetical protein [Tetrasphaera sp.]HNQ06741.1 hypothetical protein [Tetrasphaera sp.]